MTVLRLGSPTSLESILEDPVEPSDATEDVEAIQDSGEEDFDMADILTASSTSSEVLEVDQHLAFEAGLARYCLENYERGPKLETRTLEELVLPQDWIAEMQETWTDFIEASGSKQAAGEAIWDSIIELSPGIEKAFGFPRQVFALRFMTGASSLVADCGDPDALKQKVEVLGFQHMLVVSETHAETFAMGIAYAMDGQLGQRFTSLGFQSFRVFWHYIGGAFLFVKREYGGRVRRIRQSWRLASDHTIEEQPFQKMQEDEDAERSAVISTLKEEQVVASPKSNRIQTPQNFYDMFLFNASIMGYAETEWMSCILGRIGAMASNADKPSRLQEECNVLALTLSHKHISGKQKLPLSSFKTVLLASFRSVMPQHWDMEYEEAWNWFWGEIGGILTEILGKLSRYRRSIQQLIQNLGEDELDTYRSTLFQNFFETTPAAKDYFKVSTTRLYFILDRILVMAMEIFIDPENKVAEVSSVGLKHVGMNIPSEMFAPLADTVVDCIEPYMDPRRPMALDAMRWSMRLIAQIMTRVTVEGSTLVTKAVSQNDITALQSALAITPRGRRAQDVLRVTVGSQSISPLYWSIEAGHLDCAHVILEDLMTIRADREAYYYGCSALFERHTDIILKLCVNAPSLLWPLVDGLIWRSRIVKDKLRPANYYIKHLIQDTAGNFSENIECLTDHGDPKVIIHPAVKKATDVIWFRLVMFPFLLSRMSFLLRLCVLVASQSFLQRSETREVNMAIAICRAFLYIFGAGSLLCQHVMHFCRDVVEGDIKHTVIGPIPRYLLSLQWAGSAMLLLMLLAMLAMEPVIWCYQYGVDQGDPFTRSCPGAQPLRDWYSTVSASAVLVQWFVLLDLSVFSTRVSAFLLACQQMLLEVTLSIASICFVVLAFAAAMNTLDNTASDVHGVHGWALTLMRVTLGIIPIEKWNRLQSEFLVQIVLAAFTILVFFIILNLIVAQLVQSYGRCFADLKGIAQLNRASLVASMAGLSRRRRWSSFLESLHLEAPLEFNEGDVGPAGGVRVLEPAGAYPVRQDSIHRFGGLPAPESPWPEPEPKEDPFERFEKMLLKLRKQDRQRRGHSKSSSSYMSGESSRMHRRASTGSSTASNCKSTPAGQGHEGQKELASEATAPL